MSDDNKITFHAFTELVARCAKVSSVEADAYIHQLAMTMSEELETGGEIFICIALAVSIRPMSVNRRGTIPILMRR